MPDIPAPRRKEDAAFDSRFVPGSFTVGSLFPTPLAVATLADHEAIDAALVDAVDSRMQRDLGVRMSNVGAWHSTDFLSWSGDSGARLIEAARLVVGRMTLMDGPAGLVPAAVNWRITAWANVIGPGDSNKAHAHPGAFWSGVYWVDDGGAGADRTLGGQLELADPRGVLPAMAAPGLYCAVAECLNAGRVESLAPASGTMVLFPSWLTHAVTPYTGRRRRISVAFNFSL